MLKFLILLKTIFNDISEMAFCIKNTFRKPCYVDRVYIDIASSRKIKVQGHSDEIYHQ